MAKVTGFLNVTTGIHIPDGGDNDSSISIGSGNDLRFYHTGSHAWIKNTQGYTHICAAYVELKNAADNETMLLATQNSGVKLYHNNNQRFETHSWGIQMEATPRVDLVSQGNTLELKFINTSHILSFFEVE